MGTKFDTSPKLHASNFPASEYRCSDPEEEISGKSISSKGFDIFHNKKHMSTLLKTFFYFSGGQFAEQFKMCQVSQGVLVGWVPHRNEMPMVWNDGEIFKSLDAVPFDVLGEIF